MNGIRILLTAGLLLASAAAANAQTMSYSQAGALLAKSCGPDIDRLCPTVNLGGGALKACMEGKLSQVSAACQRDYVIAMTAMAQRAAAQQAVIKLCRTDAVRLCQGMIPEDGNLLSCLLEASKVVSAPCNQAITDAGYR